MVLECVFTIPLRNGFPKEIISLKRKNWVEEIFKQFLKSNPMESRVWEGRGGHLLKKEGHLWGWEAGDTPHTGEGARQAQKLPLLFAVQLVLSTR